MQVHASEEDKRNYLNVAKVASCGHKRWLQIMMARGGCELMVARGGCKLCLQKVVAIHVGKKW